MTGTHEIQNQSPEPAKPITLDGVLSTLKEGVLRGELFVGKPVNFSYEHTLPRFDKIGKVFIPIAPASSVVNIDELNRFAARLGQRLNGPDEGKQFSHPVEDDSVAVRQVLRKANRRSSFEVEDESDFIKVPEFKFEEPIITVQKKETTTHVVHNQDAMDFQPDDYEELKAGEKVTSRTLSRAIDIAVYPYPELAQCMSEFAGMVADRRIVTVHRYVNFSAVPHNEQSLEYSTLFDEGIISRTRWEQMQQGGQPFIAPEVAFRDILRPPKA